MYLYTLTVKRKKMSTELEWIKNKAKVTKEYTDCLEYKFNGKVPYRMAINTIQKNTWQNIYENKNIWEVSNPNVSVSYDMKTGILNYTSYVAR